MLNAETELSAELVGWWEYLAQETDTSPMICAKIAKEMFIFELVLIQRCWFCHFVKQKRATNHRRGYAGSLEAGAACYLQLSAGSTLKNENINSA